MRRLGRVVMGMGGMAGWLGGGIGYVMLPAVMASDRAWREMTEPPPVPGPAARGGGQPSAETGVPG